MHQTGGWPVTYPYAERSRSVTVGPLGEQTRDDITRRDRARPPGRGHGARRLLAMAFWLCLIAGIVLWWRDTPAGSVESVPEGLVEASRITGLIAGYLLLTQVLLMSRVGWLDRRLSANDLIRLKTTVSGVTYSCEAWKQSLQSAISQI